MRDRQSHQSTNADRTAESTINQSQQTMERLIDLQRNMAEMTLSALEWGESAQRQGLEMTQSMFESAPGPQFTESMMERYLEGMEAIVPEMEQAMEQGMQAATQPGMAGLSETGTRAGQTSERASGQRRRTEQRPTRQGAGMGEQYGSSDRPRNEGSQGQQRGGQRRRTGGRGTAMPEMPEQQRPPQQSMGGTRSGPQDYGGRGSTASQGTAERTRGQPGPETEQRGSSGRPRSRGAQQDSPAGEQYPQTGEWVTPQEYGGESTGATDYQQRPLSAAPSPSSASGSRDFDEQSRRGGTGPRQEPQRGPSSTQFEQGRRQGQEGRHQESRHPPTSEARQERGRAGGQSGSSDRSRVDRMQEQPSEGGQSGPGPGQTEQGRLRDQYSQRLDTDRGGPDDRPDERDRATQRRAREGTDARSEQPSQQTEGSSSEEPPEEE